MRVYVASSWRNSYQPAVVTELRGCGFDVYDFREGRGNFHWRDIDGGWRNWMVQDIPEVLRHDLCRLAFELDMNALKAADVVVLVQPCGISAHLELGHAVGAGKPTIVLLDGGEPELMYKMCDYLTVNIGEVIDILLNLKTRLEAGR